MIGLLQLVFSDIALLKRFPLLTIDLVPVVAPGHPLAEIDGPIETHVLHNHVQLVLTDRSALTAGRDYGVLSGRTWRLAAQLFVNAPNVYSRYGVRPPYPSTVMAAAITGCDHRGSRFSEGP
jgi:DNA-binding transcriptional LysR family regulator